MSTSARAAARAPRQWDRIEPEWPTVSTWVLIISCWATTRRTPWSAPRAECRADG
jgi:hypothetical protein